MNANAAHGDGPLGHNLPPSGTDPLADRLAESHAELRARTEELLAAMERVPAALDEESHDKAATFCKQLKLHAKAIDAARVDEKEPYLTSGRTIDNWFGRMKESVDRAAKSVEAKITSLLRAKADAERKAREEEARRAREEAERRAAEMKADEDLTAAVAAETTAQQAEKAAAAPVADLARTRTAYGTTSTLRTELAFEVTGKAAAVRALADLIDDEAVAKAMRAWLRLNRAAAENIIDGKADPLPGIRLFRNEIARVA